MKRSVLISGANSGIGFASVQLFLENGYFVFGHYHRSKVNLEGIECDTLMPVQGDHSDPNEVKKIFNKCINERRNIDILINNAGTFSFSNDVADISEEDFDRVIHVNLKAPFLLSQLVFEKMRERKWGRIVNISSIGLKYGGGAGSMPYTISKSGLEAMTMAFAKAGAPHNILVNAIRVGVTDTAFHDLNPNKDMKKRIGVIPLKRMATPEEIAETIFFLTSEKSSFTTGSIITVAGGE